MKIIALIVLISVALGGCSTVEKLKRGEEGGTTKVYDGAYEDVYRSAFDALEEMGFAVQKENPDKGEILAQGGRDAVCQGNLVGVYLERVGQAQTKVEVQERLVYPPNALLGVCQDKTPALILKLGKKLRDLKSFAGMKQSAVPVTPAMPAPKILPSDIDKPAFEAADRIMGDNDVAIIIGVEKYQDLPASDFSARDAKLVKDYLASLGVRERNIELLLNERATGTSIRKAVESWLPNRVKKDSRVFVYYSGHGAPDPASGEAYLVPHDGDANYLSTTGYPLKGLYEKLGALPAAEVVVVLDACFSGAGGRSVLAKGARPLVLMKEGPALAPNLAVLAATQGTQISTSSPEKGHGILTYYFLKAIKDGKKDLAEIYSSIKPLVEDEAKLLNVAQTPSLTPEPERLKGKFALRK